MSAELTLEDVKRAAKREDFRAGVRMRLRRRPQLLSP